MRSYHLIALVALLLCFVFVQARFNYDDLEEIVDSVIEEYLAEQSGDDMASTCTVNASGLNLRSSGSMQGKVLAVIPRGAKCTVYSSSGSWASVSCNGRSGYVSKQYLSCSGTSSPSPYVPIPQPAPTRPTTPSGGCTLMRYSNSAVSGSLVINKNWRSSMDQLASYARQCGVTIQITSGFRSSSNVSGAIVTPATRSNHMIGQAIDFNLSYTGGYCNSSCLRGYKTGNIPAKPKCFLDKVRGNLQFRLGVLFSTPDPVHIDSGLNVKDSRGWDYQYQQAQISHKNKCY